MIEFVTLLLGLVIGPHAVEVAVGPEAHAVRWVLDGETVAARSEPPWRVTINFGAELRPRRLTALAYDGDGVLLGQTEQLINYIRSNHEVAVVLELGAADDGSKKKVPRRGRVIAKGVLGHQPKAYLLRFDGQELTVDSGRFELPPYDTERPHAIEAEVTFSDEVVARAETTFGGGMGEEVTSALSAVAVTSRKGKPWTSEQVKGWVRRDGKPLPVFQTRADEGQVVVVRDESLSMAVLRNLPLPAGAQRRSQGHREYHLSAVSPVPIGEPANTFRESAVGTVKSNMGLLVSLVLPAESYGFQPVVGGRPDIWGALAIAGRAAASSNMPRVVILLLGEETPETSLPPEIILQYLESIQVPVLIWAANRKPLKDLNLHKHPNVFFGPTGLGSVVDRASIWLDSQTIIWIEGEHLPTEVELVADHKKAAFAGQRKD